MPRHEFHNSIVYTSMWVPPPPTSSFLWPFLLLLFLFVLLLHAACGILVPWPGIEPGPLAVKVQRPNHWTTRVVPPLSPLAIYIWRFRSHLTLSHQPSQFCLLGQASIPRHPEFSSLSPFWLWCLIVSGSRAQLKNTNHKWIGHSHAESRGRVWKLAVAEHLLNTCSALSLCWRLPYIYSFSTHTHHRKIALTLFCRGNWGSERFRNLPNVTQL